MDRKKLIIDTSFWLTLVLANEHNHEEAKKTFKEVLEEGVILYTTNDIVDETVTRIIYDNNLSIAEKFLDFLHQSIQKKVLAQLWTDEQTQEDAFAVLKKYHDHKLSMTDATTVAIMQRFKLDAVLTLDSDFKKIGVKSLP